MNLDEIKQAILKTRNDVLSIVVFGSYARTGAYHDIDLLVVVEQNWKRKLDRRPDVVELRKNLPRLGKDIDLLLYSRLECVHGFQNHNPFFLDIAVDGKVIFDQGFIAPLIEETQAYIRSQQIQRTPTGGWQFPMVWRKAVPLSPISNLEWARIWLKSAQDELAVAEELLASKHFARCVTHCQQAIEKAIKVVLSAFNRFERSHYLANILDELIRQQPFSEWEPALRKIAEDAKSLEPEAIWSRYPGERDGELWVPEDEYTQADAEEAITKARYACKKSSEFIEWWFKK